MTNFDRLKDITTVDDMAHFLCSTMDDLTDGYPCDNCPVSEKCEFGNNGFIEWLREEAKC